jgi:hypothetical protein
MRVEIANTLPDTGWIDNLTVASDGEGGYSEAWAAVSWTPSRTGAPGTTVAYRMDPLDYRGQMESVALAEAVAIQYVLILEWDAPIAAGTVTRFVNKDGRAYNIRMLTPDNSYRLLKRCYLSEIR